jgi:hypothetical protein
MAARYISEPRALAVADPHISEIWRNWAIIVVGGAGLAIAIWRGYAADRQSRASRSQADTARRAHITEVYKDAVGQLSHERLEIRLGAIFTLKQISEDFPEFKHYVFQILTAYAKERSAGADPGEDVDRDMKEIMAFLHESSPADGEGAR